MSSLVEPRFPLDLEREIFETAAILRPKIIPRLLLVAQRVHTWLEPMLYRVVSLTDGVDPVLPSFGRKPPDFLRDTIRHVFLDIDVTTAAAQAVLEVATETQSLALLSFNPNFDFESLAEPLGKLSKVQRLAIHKLTLPMYPSLTHLDLFQLPHDFIVSLWPQIARFPALTHLAIPCDSELAVAEHILSTCETIHVLISMSQQGTQTHVDEAILLDHDRFLTMGVGNEEYKRDWEIGVRGGVDFWARVDQFVAKKLGEIVL
ncbi:hypothetical protein FB45DRAFT_1032759 [Roridomyces roridus]|uniref:Uncharacterized protein n=1 Tax=Roridomyces roridus TaxID=1738132 RepID=A0AAD7FHA8_9AGAR|nr:hypothetical protein FB45DRAFT_1032759 [Roridomyces roridus]